MEKISTTGNSRLEEFCSIIESIPPFDNLENWDINLLEAGITSLNMMRASNILRKHGFNISFSKMISNPFIASWWNLVKEDTVQKREVAIDEECITGPFQLTDVQYAYWMGRREQQILGGNACHVYFEFDCHEIDVDKLEHAWQTLQNSHSMLRAKFNKDGTQEIMPAAYSDKLTVYDLRGNDMPEQELVTIKEKLSHRLLDVQNGQVAELGVSIISDDKFRLHFDVDLLVADMQSLQIIFRDLEAIYSRNVLPTVSPKWNFGEYLKLEEERKSGDGEAAKLYWAERIPSMPLAPALPLAKSQELLKAPKFVRRKFLLSTEEWEILKSKSAVKHTTPAMVMLTAYAEVLGRWSTNSRFLVNMPLFDRLSDLDSIENAIADFTNVLLLTMDCSENLTFSQRLDNVQKQFREDMEYSSYSGVKVVRELMKIHPDEKVIAPVVFSCNYGHMLIENEFEKTFGKMSYMISQTPQVWIDFQIFEIEGGLNLSWDCAEELFAPGMLNDMFEAYKRTIVWLLRQDDWNRVYDVIPDLAMKRGIDNIVIPTNSNRQLYTGFIEQVQSNRHNIAIIDENDDAKYTYEELLNKALKVAAFLKENGVASGDLVSVSLPRGVNQIAGILGILTAGAGYVPVNVTQPLNRRERIYKKAGIRHILTDTYYKKELDWPGDVEILDILESKQYKPLQYPATGSDTNSAYVIFTSGSTGEPKGVEISHLAAVNTIDTINEQYHVNCGDKILAVSSYDFDLSVYDIFGMLSAGGTLVLIKEDSRRDANIWLDTVNKHGITLWNSVPTLLNMLLIVSESYGIQIPTLRLAMLSGDWIGLDIPERLANAAPNSHLLSMGGATEAAIWSNYFDVKLPIPKAWRSIPYGKPLLNQYYRVVDEMGRDCPDWVPGELWIGGKGVAKGYIGDPDITKKSFVVWNDNKWYRTGDMGRYWADGNIEFLGRQDFQVKVRGHRIELGEIEAALSKYPGISQNVVSAVGDDHGNKHLVGYLIPEPGFPKSLYEVVEEDITLLDKRWEDTKVYCKSIADDYVTGSSDPKDCYVLDKCFDEVSLLYICRIFERMGISYEPGDIYSIDRLLTDGGIHPSFKQLIVQWLSTLIEKGLTLKVSEDIFTNKQSLSNLVYSENDLLTKFSSCGAQLTSLKTFLNPFLKYCKELLTGQVDVSQLLLKEDYLSPNDFLRTLPGAEYRDEMTMAILQHIVEKQVTGNKVRILEIGARNIAFTKETIEALAGSDYEYTCTDTSVFYLNNAKELLERYENIVYQRFNPDEKPVDQGGKVQYYDVIIAANSLHRCKDLNSSLEYVKSLLKAGGLLVVLETTKNTIMQQVSTSILEKGFTGFEDDRKGTGRPLLSIERWEEKLSESGFYASTGIPNDVLPKQIYNQGLIIAMAPARAYSFNPERLKVFMEDMVPSYMIPTTFMVMDTFPLSANGKINRKALPLPSVAKTEIKSEHFSEPKTELEKRVAKIWSQVLKVDKVSTNDNYFELGGDSLLATQLNSKINKELKIEFSLENIFAKPVFSEQVLSIAALMEDKEMKNLTSEQLPAIQIKPELWNEPFPLTDVQQSYWLGRNGGFALGDVSTHCYFEMDGFDINIDRAEETWQKLIERHGMMRAVFLKDGQNQKILEDVEPYKIHRYDLTSLSTTSVANRLEETRKEMEHQIFDTSIWPLFDVRISMLPERKNRIHISFDNIIFDGWSMFYILRQWKYLYDRPQLELVPLELSFRDYVLTYEKIRETDLYKKDEEYWKARIPEIFPAPELPVKNTAQALQEQKFERLEAVLDEVKWNKIKNVGIKNGLTASGLLLTAYAEVLTRWSKSPKFTINLTRFNRLPIHNQIMDMVGDFTSLTLLAVDNTIGDSFLDRSRNLQKQLWQDLAHPYYSGVELERELNKNYDTRQGAVMPIVFTSGLGIKESGKKEEEQYFGNMVYGLSQTPQVWVDHQVTEQDGKLVLTWDAVRAIFPGNMLDEMFEAYVDLLTKLSETEDIWKKKTKNLIDIPNLESRKLANKTDDAISTETLTSLVAKSIKKNGDSVAVISRQKKLTYFELGHYTNGIAHMLINENVKRNTLVAVVMDKGWEQIVAVNAILRAGAAYLPIDAENPDDRIQFLLKDADVRVVLTQSWVEEKVTWPSEVKRICIDDLMVGEMNTTDVSIISKPDDLAYIIYTSGSTGKPKGVMIDHRGAVNTILDVNQRFDVSKEDICFALSNLNFDLSVYDIFGLLSVGGTIVIPEADLIKEPKHWQELVQRYQITVWNSVPAFMEMFMEHLTKEDIKLPLKLIIMSGDWIPLDLPQTIRQYTENVRIISMGGATEASIWSNFYEVDLVNSQWSSIPYGKPLTNQKFYILDEFMQDCPVWVPGRLYIGGIGVALGYWKDENQTQQRFVTHPETKERIYYTGDLGRYWPDGNIEFLGREDNQVKIRGHRIELGEIESVLQEHEMVKNAVVIVENKGASLGAAVLLNDDVSSETEIVEKELFDYLKNKLPEYLVPGKLIVMNQFPLSVNGKVDRKELGVLLSGRHENFVGTVKEPPKDDLERNIASIWKEILGIDDIARNDDFFMCGGDSLKAVRVVNTLKDKKIAGENLAIQTLFAAPTVALLADEIKSEKETEPCEDFEEGEL